MNIPAAKVDKKKSDCSNLEQMERLEAETCKICGLKNVAGSVRRPARAVCTSRVMQDLFHRAAHFARSDAPVMVLGESGSGKEIVARVIHANSPRANRPFVAVNVAALPADLLESELFGHVRGAFTGANREKHGLFHAADGGTLFLDEIGDMPMSLQVKLLRALQNGEIRRVGDVRTIAVDVRIVCATHQALLDLIQAGTFRRDLYYRLKVLSLEVPPLRERKADILSLARQFLTQEQTAAARFAADAEEALLSYSWPGNVRELENAVRHGAALASGPTVTRIDLPEDVIRATSGAGQSITADALVSLAEMERRHVLSVVAACNGSMTEAADVLGIGRNTLWRKLKRYE